MISQYRYTLLYNTQKSRYLKFRQACFCDLDYVIMLSSVCFVVLFYFKVGPMDMSMTLCVGDSEVRHAISVVSYGLCEFVQRVCYSIVRPPPPPPPPQEKRKLGAKT